MIRVRRGCGLPVRLLVTAQSSQGHWQAFVGDLQLRVTAVHCTCTAVRDRLSAAAICSSHNADCSDKKSLAAQSLAGRSLPAKRIGSGR
jgi:hypothetical protein